MKSKKIIPVSKKLVAKTTGPSVLLADLRAMEPFILELGAGFAFVDRQKGEESPIGLILCAGKRQKTVKALVLARASLKRRVEPK